MSDTIELVVAEGEAGERLDRWVAKALAATGLDVSNTSAKSLVEAGDVTVDGDSAWRASRRVEPHMRVQVRGAARFARASSVASEGGDAGLPAPVTEVTERVDLTDEVLYRDSQIIAIHKPSGLPTHATHDPTRDHAHAAVARLLGGDAYVAVHHRLDVETSGVLVFAIDRSANKGLGDAFANRTVRKRYLALVSNARLGDSVVVRNHLGRDRHDSRRMCAVRSGGDFAETRLDVLARSARGAVVAAHPVTGRTHQIRVHLADSGAPIVGDMLYGGEAASRVMLHAHRLFLPHPVSGERLEIEAPIPPDFARAMAARDLELT